MKTRVIQDDADDGYPAAVGSLETEEPDPPEPRDEDTRSERPVETGD